MTALKSFFLAPGRNSIEFSSRKFSRNNFMILLISSVLFFEQLIYGFFFSEPESTLQLIYIFSSLSMIFFIAVSTVFYRNPPSVPILRHKAFEMSLGIFGLGVILLRLLVQEASFFRVPTVYIAVLYGMAVVLLYHYLQSLVMYVCISIAAIILIPVYHPAVTSSSFIPDVTVNGAIAWLVSAVNYRSFVKDFQNSQKIRKKNKELEELSLRDDLTGLYNRRKLNTELQHLTESCTMVSGDFSVILMDLDRFKQVNDTFGHDTGDLILKDLSILLENYFPSPYVCGRWGGEEFYIICPHTNKEQAGAYAEEFRKLLETSLLAGSHTVTSSFGVASFSEFQETKNLLNAADKRLYQAKQNGRNKVEMGNAS